MRLCKWAMGLSVIVFLTGCVNTDYVGESYAPTTQVDVYYSMDDVDAPHVVMGKITATAMDGWDSDAMVEELKAQAMAKGADALVIESVHTEKTGSHTSTYGKGSDDEWVITEDGKLKHRGSDSSSYTSITTDSKEKVMDAELLKYQ
ncbi:MAG: hypothetical protein Hals2KO_03940 [Halioglobus sp.]